MGCLWCGKYSRQCKTMPFGPPEFIPPFIPVTGMKCSYGKISSPLTEISGTEPARPLIWTYGKFYKGFRGEARSRKPGQPGQPGSYEEALRPSKIVFVLLVIFRHRLPTDFLTEHWGIILVCYKPTRTPHLGQLVVLRNRLSIWLNNKKWHLW